MAIESKDDLKCPKCDGELTVGHFKVACEKCDKFDFEPCGICKVKRIFCSC